MAFDEPEEEDVPPKQRKRPAPPPPAWHPAVDFATGVAQGGMQSQAAAIGAVNSAIDDEMESRVAQLREERRMEHEKELARMRLQAEAQKSEELIRRLQDVQKPLPPGVLSRLHIDGKGSVTRE